jgi:hypothetical protein
LDAEPLMSIIRLPYGEGLERSKGVMVVRPTSFEDLRNVALFDGKAQVRQGTALRSVLQDDQPVDLDVTVMLEPLRSLSASMGVGYNTTGGSNREVWLNRLLIDGTSPVAIGLLGTLGGDATFVPPIIVGADSDNKMFLAHDEPKFSARFVTQVFDPDDFPQISNLQGDLDGVSGQRDIFFRGVVRHLSYVFGWGYGSFTDPVRGDVLRVSNSGDSKTFEDFAFFEAGQQGETIMVCRSAGPNLLVYKENETYEIFGYSPDTFGIRLADSLFGCVGSRLAVSVAGSVFFWSTQGPRISSGGPSLDIAVPLDVGGPDPSGLVAESDPQDAFAAYDPRTRVVQFVWGQRVYALSIRDPDRPRWSYYELGETAQCSSLFFVTQSQAGGGGPPVGAPEIDTFDEETRGTLTFVGNANNLETVFINNKLYVWQTVLTDVDGNVQIGATAALSAANLIAAVTLTGVPGTDYALSMTINSDMTAGPGVPTDSVEASGRLGQGFAGNGKPLQETMSSASWNVPLSIDGIGQTATFVEFFVNNVGMLGGEDTEIHVSSDGGAFYTFSGRVAAAPVNGRQKITVLLESQSSGRKIQPLTDYKFSIRYILGGQFSPGYTDVDPDVWPAISQGLDTTTSDPIILGERVGDNEGLWERLDSVNDQLNIITEIPIGHELTEIEVFHEILEAGPDTDADDFAGPVRGDPLLSPSQLLTTYNAASPGYPLRFEDGYVDGSALPNTQTEKLNIYKMRFRRGGNLGPFTSGLECYTGPDAPPAGSITFAQIRQAFTPFPRNFVEVTWDNTETPDGTAGSGGLRVCPPPIAAGVPPRSHSTHVHMRNATLGGAWALIASVGPFGTSLNLEVTGTFAFSVGNTIHIALHHRVKCFGTFFSGQTLSEWGEQGGGLRYVTRVVILA